MPQFDSDDDHFADQDFRLDLDSADQSASSSSQPPPRIIDPSEPLAQPPLPERESSQPPPSLTTIVAFPVASKSGPSFPTISGLFPRASVNLLGGSSFSGRTRFILPQFDHYAAGLPFLGRPIPDPPEQLGMIVCGRGGEDVKARIEQLGLRNLTDQAFPVARWTGRIRDESEYSPVFPLEKCYEDLTAAAGRPPRFLLIESIQKLAPVNKITEYTPVCEFYDAIREWCKSHHCTVLGTVVKAKARIGAGYETIAEQLYGGVMWADNASCVIGIDRYAPTSTIRKITILAKASYGEVAPLWADFNDEGHLDLVAQPEENQQQDTASANLTKILADDALVTPGTEHTHSDFADLAKAAGVKAGSATITRWLQVCVTDGRLVKRGATSNTVYWKPLPN